jgi:predicted phage replisome organizer
MAEVKWIKLTTDMFDNRKIKYLRRLPDGDSIVLIWVMLLTMAGRCNAGGMIFLTENIPYTPKMLADELDFEENTVVLALQALDNMDMIVTKNGNYAIAGWDEYQNIEGMDKIREQNRIRQANFKAKQKTLPSNVTGNVTLTLGNATDIEEDKEKEIDLEIDNKKESVTCKQVVDLFHSICISFPKIRSISDARKKAIKARLNTYSLEDFKTVFENAEASSFLKGSNDRNWTATFDWLIKDSNMAKVLEGNYADKGSRYGGRKEKVPGWLGYQHSESELDAIRRVMEQEDPEAQEERDQLARELQESFGRNI